MKKEVQKFEKYNFEKMKAAATSPDPEVRKQVFKEYFERFEEFPSFLFDNEKKIDASLLQTIQDLTNDPETPKGMRDGLALLLHRLPAQ
jgi:oligoendopeptidase F